MFILLYSKTCIRASRAKVLYKIENITYINIVTIVYDKKVSALRAKECDTIVWDNIECKMNCFEMSFVVEYYGCADNTCDKEKMRFSSKAGSARTA